MKRINILELWETEWNNAHKFFNSKGNVKTKSGLKDKWYKDFKNMLMTLEKTITENLKTSYNNSFIQDCYNIKCNHYRKSKMCKKYLDTKDCPIRVSSPK